MADFRCEVCLRDSGVCPNLKEGCAPHAGIITSLNCVVQIYNNNFEWEIKLGTNKQNVCGKTFDDKSKTFN